MSWFHGRQSDRHTPIGGRLPLARADELVVEEVGDELLIYDKATNRAHYLTTTAVQVWRACNGHTSAAVLATKLDLNLEILEQVLDELDGNSLLQDTPQVGHTRREMTKKAAKLGTAASVPFIYSVLGPVPMAAATPTEAQCAFYTAVSCGKGTSGNPGCAGVCGCACSCQCTLSGVNCSLCVKADICGNGPSRPTTEQCRDIVTNSGGVTTGCTAAGCSSIAPPGDCFAACTGTAIGRCGIGSCA